MTRTLQVDLGARSYPIRIGPGLLAAPAEFAVCAGRPILLLTDRNVADLHLPTVQQALGLADERILVVDAGESAKQFGVLEQVLDWMLGARLPRDGVLIALGGGVIGDLGGFAAAVYQRGIDFLQIPTSLLAQVDSSVGGKTAINHPLGKNMIGAFHQPRAVLADTEVLKTLPEREWLAGLAEVIKYALLGDADFLTKLEQQRERLLAREGDAVAPVIEHCCRMKAAIVAQDERESGQRAVLNLGHTFGHAIEAEMGYGQWLHGEAVAAGMVMAAEFSTELGWLNAADAQRARALIQSYGLPVQPPPNMTAQHFQQHMALDKKVAAGKLRLILLQQLGRAVMTDDFTPDALQNYLAQACQVQAA